MKSEEGEDPPEATGERLSPTVLVHMLRGFTAVFWGLPLSLLLYFGAVEIHFVSRFRLPTYIAGIVVVYLGLAFLRFSGWRNPTWKRHGRDALIASFLLIYLGPFVFWYTYLPRSGPYYLANLALCLLSVMLLLFSVNRLAAELGGQTGDDDLRVESRICSWSVLLLMGLPLMLGAAFGLYLAMKYDSTLLTEMRNVRHATPIWVHIFFLVPLSLTMTSAWKAKERCITLLKHMAVAP